MVRPNSPYRRLEVLSICLRYQNEKWMRRAEKTLRGRIAREVNAVLDLCKRRTCRTTDCQRCAVSHRLAMLDTWTASLCYGSKNRRTP